MRFGLIDSSEDVGFTGGLFIQQTYRFHSLYVRELLWQPRDRENRHVDPAILNREELVFFEGVPI